MKKVKILLSLILTLATVLSCCPAILVSAADEVLLSSGKTATASLFQAGSGVAANAVDGKFDTKWSTFGYDNVAPVALQVDLGQVQEISKFGLSWYGTNRIFNFEIYVTDSSLISGSDVNTTGKTAVYSGVGNGTPNNATACDYITLSQSATGRYVTVVVTGFGGSAKFAVLAELEVWGGSGSSGSTEPVDPAKGLLSGHDVVTTFAENGAGVANAIDDNIATRWSSYGGTLPAAMMVDTFQQISIDQVEILMFQNNRNYDLELYLSDSPTIDSAGKMDLSQAKKIASDNCTGVGDGATKPSAGTPMSKITTDNSVKGRYFTLVCTAASSGTAVALWEVEAYGTVHGDVERKVLDIQNIAPVSVPFGTTDLSAVLPKEVEVLVEGNELSSTEVKWDTNGFNGNQVGSVVLKGSFVNQAINVNELTPEITVTVRSQAEDQAVRQQFTINDNWLYIKGDVENGHAIGLNTERFHSVSLPHTFNAYDGQDGGGATFVGNFYKGPNWYRKVLKTDSRYEGKQVKLYFEGVSRTCEVYVNGVKAGSHDGAFTAFEIDVTSLLKANADNLIAVRVDSTNDGTTSPITGDFTVFGGIYRDVSVRLTDSVYVGQDETSDFGMKLTQKSVSKSSATLGVSADLVNATASSQSVTATVTLKNPSASDVTWIDEIPDVYLPFNKSQMTPGGTVATKTVTVNVPANGSYALNHDFVITNPHLWNGLADPYRYMVEIQLQVGGKVVDTVSDFVGLRTFTVDSNKGAYLNGNSYNLRGVSRHQDRENMGWAITQKEHNEDIALIYKMGANAVRLAHYPQSDYTYDLCDQYGLCVWAEVSLVNEIGGEGTYESPNAVRAEFFTNVKQELKEMILQQYNHPSIVVWGIENECYGTDDTHTKFMAELNNLAHTLDTTRLTTLATQNGAAYNWKTNLAAWNLYPGWYNDTVEDMDTIVAARRAEDKQKRPIGISEYGLGANAQHHADDETIVCSQATPTQSQEYQAYGHEKIYADIEKMDFLWCAFVWNMFDFSSDWRSEGGVKGINTKGLVSRDRQTLKDAYYFYQATWSSVPMVHLNAKDYTERYNTFVDIKSYSNCDSVTLYVNDKKISTKNQVDMAQFGVFKWADIELQSGDNTVRLVAVKDGKEYTEEAVWKRMVSDSVEITSETVGFSNYDAKIWLSERMTVSNFMAAVKPVQRAVLTVCDADGNAVTNMATTVEVGMQLQVVSESGKIQKTYTIEQPSLAYKKPITVSSFEATQNGDGYKLTDGDTSTRWIANISAGVKYPESFVVDLGAIYNLDQVDVYWFVSGDRKYFYNVAVRSSEEDEWTMVSDKTKNESVGKSTSVIENGVSGRYVLITATGNSHTTPVATCFELMVYGYTFTSTDKSYISEDIIMIDAPYSTVSTVEMNQYFNLSGNATVTYETKIPGVVANGDTLILNHSGKTDRYRVANYSTTENPNPVDEQILATVAAIDALPEASDVKADDAAAIHAAQQLYDSLSDTQKRGVTNLQKLLDAKEALDRLQGDDVIYGDANSDGAVDSADALEILKSIVGKTVLDDAQTLAADVDGDEKITATDALFILRLVVGKIDQFPVEA
ncbi:MAG: discoidin domain-containing protein [Clostridia bacterium]|nr:discoidin domain-containing protein [Clostridia bacterium]